MIEPGENTGFIQKLIPRGLIVGCGEHAGINGALVVISRSEELLDGDGSQRAHITAEVGDFEAARPSTLPME